MSGAPASRLDPNMYPASGTADDQLRFLLDYAILAPSGHNTQPWRFRIGGGAVDVIADRSRRLPVVDPDDRALVISCGGAVAMLRVAMRRFGHAGQVSFLPNPEQPDLLARVTLGEHRSPEPADVVLFDAIAKRRTTRRALTGPLPDGLGGRLLQTAAREGVEAAVVTDQADKAAIAELVEQGDRMQFADPGFRRELGKWIRPNSGRSRDGLSGANFGLPDRLSRIGGLVVRSFDMGKSIGAKDRALVEAAPAVLAFATADDTPLRWLEAGHAHALAFLEVASAGLTAAYINQPVESALLRPRLRQAARLSGIPQLLLRIGRGPAVPAAVRRPLREVLIEPRQTA